jgi:MFS family permease
VHSHARWESKREHSEPNLKVALRALGSHRALNDAIHRFPIIGLSQGRNFLVAGKYFISESARVNRSGNQPGKGAWTALALLLGINLFNYIDRYILAAVEPEIRRTFFLPDDPDAMAKTGALATAFLVSYMVTAPLFGWLADRVSRWWIVGLSVAVWSLASAGSGLAATFSILLITRLFVGIGEAGYGPSAPTIISDHFPISFRGRALAFFYMAIPVGSALGYALGGGISAHFGSWRFPFYLVAPPGLALGALCLFMRDPRGGKAERRNEGKRKSKIAGYTALLRNPSYVLNTLAMTAMTFAIGGLSFWIPGYIFEYRHQPDLARINMIFGGITVVAGFLATLLGGIVGDRLTKRFPGAYFMLSGCGMFCAFPFTVAFLYAPFPLAWLFVFLAVFCLFFNTGPSNTALANVTHPSVRATAFALNIFVIHALGDAISPPLIGWIAGRWRMNAAFLLVAAVMLVAGGIWLAGVKFLGRDTARVLADSGKGAIDAT